MYLCIGPAVKCSGQQSKLARCVNCVSGSYASCYAHDLFAVAVPYVQLTRLSIRQADQFCLHNVADTLGAIVLAELGDA